MRASPARNNILLPTSYCEASKFQAAPPSRDIPRTKQKGRGHSTAGKITRGLPCPAIQSLLGIWPLPVRNSTGTRTGTKKNITKTTLRKNYRKSIIHLGLTSKDGNAHERDTKSPRYSVLPLRRQSNTGHLIACFAGLTTYHPLTPICGNGGNTICSPFAHSYGLLPRLRDCTGLP